MSLLPMLGGLVSAGMSLIGGNKAQKSQERMAEQNIALQKQFAQEGIQWKVADAKAAGIHPLYALGAQTHSFAPVSVGDSLSSAWANAGQDLGRAINATSNSSQRTDAATRAATALALEKAGLENELLRSQIRRNNSAGSPPPSPAGADWGIPGQGSTQLPGVVVEHRPHEITGRDPERGFAEHSSIPGTGYYNNPAGGYTVVPSADVKQRIEDVMPAEWMWAVQNYLGSAFNPASTAPNIRLPWGKIWRWNPYRGHYQDTDPRFKDAGAGRFSPGRRLKFRGD